MKFGLTQKTIDKINTVFDSHSDIREVIIYGSRAKGNFREGSDIDITLKGKNISSTTLLKINQQIDDLNTLYLFDVSIFEKLESKDFIEHIDRVGKTFYKKMKLE
jgi:predicted nucleotidyltransferase